MKIAILHEMLIKLGGAEKVVENWMILYPDASIFTLMYNEKNVGKIFPKSKINQQVFGLKSQIIYDITKKQRLSLAFMSLSIEELDFSEYDIILCSSSGFAHGAITKPESKFVVYYHSPARYLWDWTNEFKKDLGLNFSWKNVILKPILNRLFLKNREWDYIASARVDINIANSLNTKNRIAKYYKKDAQIIYPPIETDRFSKNISSIYKIPYNKEKYYIIISTLTEYKKIDIAINGFNNLQNHNLIIIGAGDYKNILQSLIKYNNIKLVGPKYGDELVYLVQNSLGLIFPGEEDFGIVPIEVMSAGKPVFAFKGGGLTETVIQGVTGDFFFDKDGSDFVSEFSNFDIKRQSGQYSKENCIKQAKRFDKKIFEEEIQKIIKG